MLNVGFGVCQDIYLQVMDQYVAEIPKIIESRTKEFTMRSRVYEEDALTRAELGLKLFAEGDGLSDAERLERVRDAVSADSVSLLDGQGQVLSTTGPVSPVERFSAAVRELEPHKSRLEFYPSDEKTDEETAGYAGKGLVLLPVPGSAKRSLVFEFDCESVLKLYNALGKWSDVLNRLVSGELAAGFAKTGDMIEGYPVDSLSDAEREQLYDEVENLFLNSGKFRRRGDTSASRLVTLLGDRYLAALSHYEEENADVMLVVPLESVVMTGICSTLAIAGIIGCGIVLFQLYALHCLPGKKDGKGAQRTARGTTLIGILVVLAVTVIFSTMLLLLEARANTAVTAMNRRESVQHEIDWHGEQEKTIRKTFSELYRTRTQILADYLAAHPDYESHAGLRELNELAGTDYLMRFDSSGEELYASNSYTGFTVGGNLNENYRAVLMGYPYASAGPEPDRFTGRMQLGSAVLMTDAEGEPDGFLLAVYSAGDLNEELERISYENTVNSYAVPKGHYVAAVNDADGRIIAHTDPEMIGRALKDYIPDFEPGVGFDAFGEYGEDEVYVSASAADGKTLAYIVTQDRNVSVRASHILLAMGVLLILALLYYPVASELSSRAVAEAWDKHSSSDNTGSSMKIFADGYYIFLTLLAIVALAASLHGLWPAFSYVFSEKWVKGVHLVSLWAALFTVAVTLCCTVMIRAILHLAEKRMSLRGKTVIRLVDSLISYVVGIFLLFCILDMFGVNTTTLLASAGVISIAVGMGAQSMAADLLAGFFMMVEGSVHVGDYVSVSGVKGHVTDMGIRTTEITDDDGNVVIFNNSKVSSVLNMSRKNMKNEDEELEISAP